MVRQLPAVDTLGCINVLCTDKTGTLTTAKTEIAEIHCPGIETIYLNGKEVPNSKEAFQIRNIFQTALLYCENGKKVIGELQQGKPGEILANCSITQHKGELRRLSYAEKAVLLKRVEEMRRRGLKVTAFAKGETFIGLAGLKNPARADALNLVNASRQAGVLTIMVTGDDRECAVALAKELGILPPKMIGKRSVLTGEDLNRLTGPELSRAITETRVWAQMTPCQKQRLIEALKQSGKVVGMLGDGINDAPAIRSANVGIVMGGSGAKTTRETAPVILVEDNLDGVSRGIREGRAAYDNIRKTLRYALSTNLGDGVGIIWTTLLGKGVSMEPLQLLLVNLVSDPFVSWILANDPPHPAVMTRPPRVANQSIFSGGLGRRIISNSVITGISGIFVNNWSKKRGDSETLSRTLAMATATLSRIWQLSDIRKVDQTYLGKLPPNPLLPLAGALMLIPISGVIYFPQLRTIFRTAPLGAKHWQAAFLGSSAGFLVDHSLNSLFTAKIKKPSHMLG